MAARASGRTAPPTARSRSPRQPPAPIHEIEARKGTEGRQRRNALISKLPAGRGLVGSMAVQRAAATQAAHAGGVGGGSCLTSHCNAGGCFLSDQPFCMDLGRHKQSLLIASVLTRQTAAPALPGCSERPAASLRHPSPRPCPARRARDAGWAMVRSRWAWHSSGWTWHQGLGGAKPLGMAAACGWAWHQAHGQVASKAEPLRAPSAPHAQSPALQN